MEEKGKNILFEVMLSLGASNIERLSKGVFHCRLSEIGNFGSQKVKVGVKNIEIPRVLKKIDFEFYAGHFLEHISEKNFEKCSISYSSCSDLCRQVEKHVLSKLSFDAFPNLDFVNSNSNMISDFFKFSLTYCEYRYVMKKHNDLVLIVSNNLAYELGFEQALKVSQDDAINNLSLQGYATENRVNFKDNFYTSDSPCFFFPGNDSKVYFALYDVIQSCTVFTNGCREPILFLFDLNEKNSRPNKLICEKNVAIYSLKDFKFAMFNSKFEPFDLCNSVNTMNDFSCTLVFYYD